MIITIQSQQTHAATSCLLITENGITKAKKTIQFISCIFSIAFISTLSFAGDQSLLLDCISNKIVKETKAEHDQHVRMALRFAGAHGNRLNSVVNYDSIEKIFIPYSTNIDPAQITYLFQNAVFKKYHELTPWHLLPTGTFKIILKDYSVLLFHMYAGAPMVRVTAGTDEYWLEIPDHKTFYSLGREKAAAK
jgi:hypothetical protein